MTVTRFDETYPPVPPPADNPRTLYVPGTRVVFFQIRGKLYKN
jgi:hypothetical protein